MLEQLRQSFLRTGSKRKQNNPLTSPRYRVRQSLSRHMKNNAASCCEPQMPNLLLESLHNNRTLFCTAKNTTLHKRNAGQLFRPYQVSLAVLYHDLPHWGSNQWPQNAEPKLYNRAICLRRTQVTPNKLFMVFTRPINLKVSCKLHPYSLQRTRSPPGLRLPRKIGIAITMTNWFSVTCVP